MQHSLLNHYRFGLIVPLLLFGSGCDLDGHRASEPPPKRRAVEVKTAPEGKSPASDVTTPSSKTSSQDVASPAPPTSESNFDHRLRLTRRQVRVGQLEEARRSLDALRGSVDQPTPRQAADLAAMEVRWLEKSGRARGEVNAQRLVHAGALLDQDDWDAAGAAIEKILAAEPDDAQREEAVRLGEIARLRKAQAGRLDEAMLALAGDDPQQVQQAQERLFENPAAAMRLLKAAAASENHRLVRHALQSLGKLPASDDTLSVMLSVLQNVNAEANWPDAIKQIGQLDRPGAGLLLLELATSAEGVPQRIAALSALALVPDPPTETFLVLLPAISTDGRSLAAALLAARHAVTTHGQQDVLSRRGLEAELSEDSQRQLAALPKRLAEIIAGNDVAAATAARQLAIATRGQASKPLDGVRVLAFGGEAATAPAAAVLDGVWKTVDKKQMWQYPVNQPGVLVLDLGEQRTVTGIRIWNFNEPGGMHRGWKEATVYVGSSTEELATLSARGQIPAAPGTATAVDYSTVIPVRFVRGRYVRLKAESFWRADTYGGLTEVQVLGF